MSKPLFSAIMEDGSISVGGLDYFSTKWKDIPKDKKIKRLFYLLPSGDYICLSGYDKYYHYVEVLQDLSGQDKGKVKFQFACVLAEKDNQIICYKIDLKDKKNLEYKIYKINDPFILSLNKNGWK